MARRTETTVAESLAYTEGARREVSGFPIGSPLTEDEISIAAVPCIDLGPGYPPMIRDDGVLDIWDRSCAEAFRNDSDAIRRVAASRALAESVADILGISDVPHRVFPVVTGSVALDRAVDVAIRRRGPVVFSSPVIDLIPGMIGNRSRSRMTVVRSSETPLTADYAKLAHEVRQSAAGSCIVVSPLNPTGQVASRDELLDLGRACVDVGAILLADQCFALTSPWGEDIPQVADIGAELPDLEWLQIWDTGKTFGLNDLKLGFVIAGRRLAPVVEDGIHLLQFDVPHVLKLFFSELFTNKVVVHDIVDSTNDSVRRNFASLTGWCERFGLALAAPQAGTLAVAEARRGSPLYRKSIHRILLDVAKVGVIDGASFLFSKSGKPLKPKACEFLRFALARNPGYFHEGLERITSWLDAESSAAPGV